MKYLLLCLIVLGGCATEPPVTVNVPVPVPCKIEEPLQPTYRYQPPYDNIFDAVRDLLGDRELAASYENELRVALKSCK